MCGGVTGCEYCSHLPDKLRSGHPSHAFTPKNICADCHISIDVNFSKNIKSAWFVRYLTVDKACNLDVALKYIFGVILMEGNRTFMWSFNVLQFSRNIIMIYRLSKWREGGRNKNESNLFGLLIIPQVIWKLNRNEIKQPGRRKN